MMKQSELDSSEYFLKIRFKKCEEVIQNWTAWFAAIMQSNPPVFFKTTNLKNKAKLNNHTSLSMLFYWVYVVFFDWINLITIFLHFLVAVYTNSIQYRFVHVYVSTKK
jgi:hypothetical protein